MNSRGLSRTGLARLDEAMASQVSGGEVPGLVVALSRGDDVHIEAIGALTPDGQEPIASDAIFRITSMTRPVTAVATLLLVDDGRLVLDEPVDRLLPELAGRRVLRRLDGPVDDTVAARRPITVRDLLTFRGGFGMILAAPDQYPILQAEQDLELRSVGPPTPATPHGADEWMRRMGTLPLMDQPGEHWRYNTGSQILGVLIARASGQPLESFYSERIFAPLGMDDTGFTVSAAQRHRLVPCYHKVDGRLELFDDGDQWSRSRAFADGGAGLVSTVGDYLAFAKMLMAGGCYPGGCSSGSRLLSAELTTAMTTDQLTAQQRAEAGPILDGRGWGFGLSLIDAPKGDEQGPQGYGWSGGFGTAWITDPGHDLIGILGTQVLAGPASSAVEAGFWTAAYQALDG
jgi:CubicO group peptidase (beta-lactamase class C family)